ncbi:MAG: glycosyltransferase [Desulfobacterales bacterium]|nr:glycosyltransferase [Desulfobacterales bacterium]
MENFLSDLIQEQNNSGINASAIVHRTSGAQKKYSCSEYPIYSVPSYGRFIYAPISPTFPIYFKKIIAQIKPDIIHFHKPNTSAFSAILLSSAKSIPWVIHWHSDVVSSTIDKRLQIAYRLYKPFEHYMVKKSKAIITTSSPYLEYSQSLSPWRNKCHVVSLGVDPKRFVLPNPELISWAEHMWQDNHFRVLTIGRLTYYKGHEILIKAASLLPTIQVIIVGTGDTYSKLKHLILQLGLQSRVILTGFLDESKMNALLSTCNCFCLPSVERTEAFGLVLLEAMAFSKPIVASKIPGTGIGWVVSHNETGLCIPPADPSALASALTYLSEYPEIAQKMGKSALLRFNQEFQIKTISQRIVQIYQSIGC